MWEGIAGKNSKLKTKLGQNYGATCMPNYRIRTLYGESMVLFNTFRDKIRFAPGNCLQKQCQDDLEVVIWGLGCMSTILH